MFRKNMATDLERETTCKAIESSVKDWLKARNNTIEIKFTAETPSNGLVEQDFFGRLEHGPTFKHSRSVPEQENKTFFSIHFTKPVSPTTTVEELKNTLQFVTLDNIPLPDFDYPPGWKITPRTPVSSFKKGVEIVSYENGRLHYKVDTMFFRISGHLRGPWYIPGGCGPPAPPGSYFGVDEGIRGIIDVDMPLKFL
jgi:hypothetical protein